MASPISIQKRGRLAVVRFSPEATQLPAEVLLAEMEQAASEADSPPLFGAVVDLGQLEYFGSALLEAVLRLWSRLAKRNGQIVFCNVKPLPREILAIAQFDTLWPIAADVDAALTLLTDFLDGEKHVASG